MAANLLLFDFSVDPSQVQGDNQMCVIFTKMENLLRSYLTNLKLINNFTLDGSTVKIFTSDRGTLITLRIYNHGLITINIEYFRGDNQEALISYERCLQFKENTHTALTSFRSKQFPAIKRGAKIDVYLTSSDERLFEYDIDRVVYEEKSPYQNIQILHSKSLGNMLILDDLQNLSEGDLIYTETLMQRRTENYKDKEIVILGGGDGALLYELLKENPRFVTMLELDESVMRVCNEYMRSVCGDVLEKRSASNYQIVVGDCMKSLSQFASEGKKYDYVFGDLTDIPISETPTGETWNFVMKILQMSFKILKPSGKFMTHGNSVNCSEALEMYEAQLRKLNPPVTINKTTAFVPSFLEDWVFYQITFSKNT